MQFVMSSLSNNDVELTYIRTPTKRFILPHCKSALELTALTASIPIHNHNTRRASDFLHAFLNSVDAVITE